jgi:osmotically-inducible protein OsmY
VKQENTMKKLALTLMTAASLTAAWTFAAGCTPAPGVAATRSESAGQFVDASVITTQVKAAILDDPTLKSFQIRVETVKDVVQLSGFVDSAAAVRRAGELAARVKGVASVRNDLLLR